MKSRKREKKSGIFLRGLPAELVEYNDLTVDAVQLADAYISENVVGKTSRNDCLHIAIATVAKVDVLVSWNFKHIVNIYRIRGYNSVNIRHGYGALEIRSPKDIVGDENQK